MSDAIPTITNKQQVFVNAYVTCWNATEAARQAGYAHPNAQGPRLLVNVGIAAAIKAHIDAIMPAGEVLQRLAAHARGTMADFIDPGEATLDLAKAEEAGKLDLIKKFSRTESDKSTHVSIELYDAQAALEKIGKYHGLFRDRVEHSGTIGTYDVDIGADDDGSAG